MKSLTELRALAQSLGVPDVFKKERNQLEQAVLLKQQEAAPKPIVVDIPLPMYIPTAVKASEYDIIPMITPYVSSGLKFRIEGDRWYMSIGKMTDEGTMLMPVRAILGCAQRLMR